MIFKLYIYIYIWIILCILLYIFKCIHVYVWGYKLVTINNKLSYNDFKIWKLVLKIVKTSYIYACAYIYIYIYFNNLVDLGSPFIKF